jgi:CubicO group peptidase (beta-lactamase class C family)
VTVAPADAEAAAALILPLVTSLTNPDGSGPATAAVVVTPDETILRFVAGSASIADRRAAEPDTLFYVASQTKSYVGLLAAQLDRNAILPLDTRLADVWPDLILPEGARSDRITMRMLLTHRVPLGLDDLVDRTSWREEVPAADYPQWLAGAEVREAGYRYDNLGYLIYAAALETATATSWKEWLQRAVCRPLGLSRTTARGSDFSLGDLAWRHIRMGRNWVSLPPKADGLLHAAGGLFTSARDLGTWMQVNLRAAAAGLPSDVFGRAQRPVVRAAARDGPFRWTHYALGQQRGSIAGFPVLGHRGGYQGARSITVFSRRAGIGLALAAAADHGMRDLFDRVAATFFDRLANRRRK